MNCGHRGGRSIPPNPQLRYPESAKVLALHRSAAGISRATDVAERRGGNLWALSQVPYCKRCMGS
eukprot:9466364-Alexandrium_andersonii.AAC.1